MFLQNHKIHFRKLFIYQLKNESAWKKNNQELIAWNLELENCLKSEIKKGLKSQHVALLFGIFYGPFDPDGFWWSPTLGVLPVFRIKRFAEPASQPL